MDRNSLRFESRFARYFIAAGLAILAQIARLLLPSPTIIPFITYAPFAVVSAILGGFGPGLLTVVLCTLESLYFAVEPVRSFAVKDPTNWYGIAALALTGVIASLLAEQLKRTQERLEGTNHKLTCMLESISDGFNAFDRDWRYTYVNAAGARLVGKAPEELLGKSIWELWPQAYDSPFGVAYRRAVAENIQLQVESFYGEPLNRWYEVRCYPSPEGLTLFFTDTTEARRTRDQLRLSEQRFRALVTASSDVVYRMSPDWSEMRQLHGRSFIADTEAPDRDWLNKYIHPDDQPRVMADIREVVRTKSIFELEHRVLRVDGSLGWTFSRAVPLENSDGEITEWFGAASDITERKRAAEESRLLASIIECSEDAIISENLDGVVLTWNPGAERVYGYSAEEMIGQPVSRLLPPDSQSEIPEILEYVRLGEKIQHMETARVRKDGKNIFVSLTVSPVRDDSGNIIGASVISRDITVRKLAEEALEHSELRYRSLVRAVAQIVWTTNGQGEVVEDIPAWREFTGQTLKELLGWRWLESLHPDDRAMTADIWSRAVQNRSFYSTEYRMRRQDGEYRWMAAHGVPMLDDRGVVREWVGLCTDVHDRVVAEHEVRKLNRTLEERVAQRTADLQAANKELESFAYSVSHDLRAPLRAVDGFSRILLEEYADHLPDEPKRFLGIVRTNAVQMGNLIDALLAFSRLGRQALSKQLVMPMELVRQVLADLDGERQGRQVEISVGELPDCQGDPLLLKQVFFNLLSNALKYTRKCQRGQIHVGSVQYADLAEPAKSGMGAPNDVAGDARVYYVRDNGAGFDMRYSNKLFGVFQRLHKAEEFEGIGVGLANVLRIVTRHGGRIWAQGAVNDGATFYFTLSPAGSVDSSAADESARSDEDRITETCERADRTGS